MADLIPIPMGPIMGIPLDPWDPSLSHSHAHLYLRVTNHDEFTTITFKSLQSRINVIGA